jgi:DNA-binding response OmpR family regulator
MMKYFLDHADKIVERDKMTSFIWGSKKLSSENTLDTHLLNLKKKVPLLRDYLKTLPRVGYMLSSERKVV